MVDLNLSSETYLFFLHLITIHALRGNKIFLTKLVSSELVNLAWVPKVADMNLIFISTSLCSCKKKQSPFASWRKDKKGGLPMYQNASSRKLKIFSQTEIKLAKGLEKARRQFWNNKGEELCRDKTLETWSRTALHGMIDTSWTLKKPLC